MEVILICLAVGAVIAFVVTGVMKGQLKTVRPRNEAGSYVVEGSFRLTQSRDVYLYKNTVRRARPKK